MAIGYLVTQNSINNRAGGLAARLKQLADDSDHFNTEITGLAPLTGVGFTSGDATAINTAAAQLDTLALVYYGSGHAVLLNFNTGLANVRGVGIPG